MAFHGDAVAGEPCGFEFAFQTPDDAGEFAGVASAKNVLDRVPRAAFGERGVNVWGGFGEPIVIRTGGWLDSWIVDC